VYLLYAVNDLELGPAAIGVIAALGGLGSLAGAAMAPRLVRRIGIGPTILVGIAGFTAGNALVPLAPAGAALLAATFLGTQQVFGDAFATTYEIVEVSLIQASAPNRVLGRVNATIHTFTTLLTLAGAILGGVLGEAMGLRATFAIGLLGALAAFAVVWFSPVRRIRTTPPLIEQPLGGDQLPITE
jgi:MFS family permease